MKALLLIVTLIATVNTFAEVDQGPYHPCTSSDMRLLGSSIVLENEALGNFIKEEVIEKNTSCLKAQRPELFHPAVCGIVIPQFDNFIITVNESVYTIVVDSSYKSCLRIRRIPVVKSFSYEPTPRVITFP